MSNLHVTRVCEIESIFNKMMEDVMSLESAGITYRYAKGSDNSRVDVLNLDSEKRYYLAPYTCIGCGGELVPNLGQTRCLRSDLVSRILRR
jgi:hypothetical protein